MATTIARSLGFLLPFARHFRAMGWRVDAVATEVGDYPICRAAFDHVTEIRWSRAPYGLSNVTAVRQIRRIVDAGQYDLVHVHTPTASFVTRFALRDTGDRPVVVYTAHGFHFTEDSRGAMAAVYRRLERLAGRWTDHLIVINPADYRIATRYRIVEPGRLERMPGIGVDLDHYSRGALGDGDVADARRQLGVQRRGRLFVTVGDFIPRKRHSDLVRALHRLSRPDVHLALVGDGPLEDEVRRLAEDLGLGARVHLLGHLPDVRPYIAAADALVLASDREGLPRAVLEAMALGTPVIGTDVRGTRDLIADDNGFLVAVGDPEGLSRAMAAVLDGPGEARRRATRASRHVAAYALSDVLERHARTYARLLSGPDRSPGRRSLSH